MGTERIFSTRLDVERWVDDAVAGALGADDVNCVAHALIDDAHERGWRYGDDWSPLLDAMSEGEWLEYVDRAKGGGGRQS